MKTTPIDEKNVYKKKFADFFMEMGLLIHQPSLHVYSNWKFIQNINKHTSSQPLVKHYGKKTLDV